MQSQNSSKKFRCFLIIVLTSGAFPSSGIEMRVFLIEVWAAKTSRCFGSRFWIVVNWTCFSSMQTFHFSVLHPDVLKNRSTTTQTLCQVCVCVCVCVCVLPVGHSAGRCTDGLDWTPCLSGSASLPPPSPSHTAKHSGPEVGSHPHESETHRERHFG